MSLNDQKQTKTAIFASPTGLRGLVPYSDSYSDSPDEMSSPEHISPLPAISPFLCTDSSEAPDSSDGPPSQDPYIATVARWRSRITARPSSSSEFPIAPVTVPSLGFVNVGPLPARKIKLSRQVSPRSVRPPPIFLKFIFGFFASSIFRFGSQSSSSWIFALECIPQNCYSTLPRRAPRHSEAFHRWCAAPLSYLYPPTTSESSSGIPQRGATAFIFTFLLDHLARDGDPQLNSIPSSIQLWDHYSYQCLVTLPPRKGQRFIMRLRLA
ncbi:hypothetical protein Tco_1508864 [Tanacetum coccineum]